MTCDVKHVPVMPGCCNKGALHPCDGIMIPRRRPPWQLCSMTRMPIMPASLESTMTVQDFRGLVACLRFLKWRARQAAPCGGPFLPLPKGKVPGYMAEMSLLLPSLCLIAFAWFCGSFPFGYWAGVLKGVDVRKHGSGNIGATNVIRVLGKKIGIPVFILDTLKGFAPVLLASWWMTNREGASVSAATMVAVLCAAAAVLGHMFTFWLGFKGGKGVATTAGAMLGLAPELLLVGVLAWVIVFYTTRYVALASIVAGFAMPAAGAILMFYRGTWNYVLLVFGVAIALLVLYRHRSNIARMLAGTENRFGKKKEKGAEE